MTKQEIKNTLANAANQLGFELVYSDLRTGCFHIKQGSIVRRAYVWRNISVKDIIGQMKTAIEYGDRLDTMPNSKYNMAATI
jgi:hypothetical protein